MKNFLLLLGGSTLAVAVYLMRNPGPQPAPGLAGRIGAWGRRERLSATGGWIKGKMEHGVGELTGSSLVGGKGLLDEATSAVTETVGKVAEAVERGINKVQS